MVAVVANPVLPVLPGLFGLPDTTVNAALVHEVMEMLPMLEKVPLGQERHVDANVAPKVVLYVLMGHGCW